MAYFDRLADQYDFFQRLIFGSKLSNAASLHLSKIKSGDKVLILGGGTGSILSSLAPGVKVDFLDLSQKMLDHARNRKTNASVEFIHADFLTYESAKSYDWIVAPFFLDVFDADNLNKVVKKIELLLAKNGRLLVTDFEDKGKLHQTLLLKAMHLFFRIAVKLESSQLQPFRIILTKLNWTEESYQSWSQGFIFSSIFIR